jgi:thiol-disulfide isomerase/thioredoxin
MRLVPRVILAIFITTLLFISCSQEERFEGSFYYTPKNLKAGGELTVKYNPDSSNLAGKEDISLIVYLYSNKLENTVDVPLTKNGKIYTGTIRTDENTLGVLLKFKFGNEVDNNNKDGYVAYITDREGNPIAGSQAGYGAAYNRWGAYYIDMDRDKEKAYKLIVNDFTEHPEIKPLFLNTYFEVVSGIKPEKNEGIIKKELDELAKSNPSGVEELTVMADWYARLGDEKLAEEYKTKLIDNYPDSEFLENLRIKEFKKEEEVDKKIKMAQDFEKDFPNSENIDYFYDIIANVYRDEKDYSTALNFLKENGNKTSSYRFYSVVKRMLDENADMDQALKIIELGVDRCRNELKNPSQEKPNYLSESEWQDQQKFYLGINLYAHGRVLYELDRREEALTAIEEATQLTNEEDDLINEFYSKLLIENGHYDVAMDKITKFIKAGYATAQMKDFLKEAYLNEKGTEDGFEAYAEQFEDAAKEKLIAKLKNEMMLEPAPAFTLKDLNGTEVSLAKYKGKTVIVDFWATWCGPCIASFPGMKKSVEKYQDDENVKFIFVNSWERVENKKEVASEFIAKNDYPFHVLLDNENKVIEKFRVSGIPTKFIIDKEGNIRFKSIGFAGSDDKLIEELSVMISLLN